MAELDKMEASCCNDGKSALMAKTANSSVESKDSVALNGKEMLTDDNRQMCDKETQEETKNQESNVESGVSNHCDPNAANVLTNAVEEQDKTRQNEGANLSITSNAENQAKKKAKKREDRGIEHVLKTLQSMETNEEKLTALSKKYAELMEDHRTMQNTVKQTQRTITVLSREKDQLQSEHSKAILAKSRLEGLCRELQKHNKIIKDESTAQAKEDEEKRKEISNRFQTTINEIQQQMNDHYQKNTSLREENLELANKLKGLIEQYELREANIEKILKTKEIEGQLYDAKLQQAALQLAEEKERSLQEKQKLLQEVMEAQKRIFLLEQQEEQLKAQLNLYSEKYEDFQSTLTKSSSVFENFKSEMEKMTKKIKKLEKETTTWRQKWESSNKALLTLAEEKALSQKEASLLQNKVSKLESLCRALQEERRRPANSSDISEGISSKSVEAVSSSTSGSKLPLGSDTAVGIVPTSESPSAEQPTISSSVDVVKEAPQQKETEVAVDIGASLVENSSNQLEPGAEEASELPVVVLESPENAGTSETAPNGADQQPASDEKSEENLSQPRPTDDL